jgi:hypothetical protein
MNSIRCVHDSIPYDPNPQEDHVMRSAIAATVRTPVAPERATPAGQPRIQLSDREETLLRIDLSDMVLPKVNDLNVDGLNHSWWSRLFSRR